MLWRGVLFVEPSPGRLDELVEWTEQHDLLGEASLQVGCLGAELQVGRELPAVLELVSMWLDPARCESWLDDTAELLRTQPVRALQAADPRHALREIVASAGALLVPTA